MTIFSGPDFHQEKREVSFPERALEAEEMWQRIQPVLPLAGITRVADLTGLDWVGIPVWMAVRPNSYSLTVSQGKGVLSAEARIGAAMESLEAYVAERAPLTTLRASYNELSARGEMAINPLELPRLKEALLSPDKVMLWARGEELFSGKSIWAPLETVNLDFRILEGETATFMRSSNGLASGSKLPEATYHALCELIERDAWTIFMDTVPLNEWPKYQLDLDTLAYPPLRALLDKIVAAGLKVVIVNVSRDINLYTMTALLFEEDSCFRPLSQRSCFFGSGTHHNPYHAMCRAVTEAIQGRLTLISGVRDDITRSKYENNFTAFFWKALDEYFVPGGQGCLDGRSLKQLGKPTVEEDIAYALCELKKAKIDQVAGFRLTMPAWPLEVVRLVIPKLETAFHIPGVTRGEREASFKQAREESGAAG